MAVVVIVIINKGVAMSFCFLTGTSYINVIS